MCSSFSAWILCLVRLSANVPSSERLLYQKHAEHERADAEDGHEGPNRRDDHWIGHYSISLICCCGCPTAMNVRGLPSFWSTAFTARL